MSGPGQERPNWAGFDPKRPLAWTARERIGSLPNVLLVMSRRDLYSLARNAGEISAWLRELGLERHEILLDQANATVQH
jgi:hypothetical protein